MTRRAWVGDCAGGVECGATCRAWSNVVEGERRVPEDARPAFGLAAGELRVSRQWVRGGAVLLAVSAVAVQVRRPERAASGGAGPAGREMLAVRRRSG